MLVAKVGSAYSFRMLPSRSLALYKNRPVLVLESLDRIDIRLEDGSVLKVREKDLVPLHEGPVTSIPPAAQGGDFDTARRMLLTDAQAASARLTWNELAELVFGRSGPAEVLACWTEAAAGLLFRIEEGSPLALSDEEVQRQAEKLARKEGEAAERSAFLERVQRIKALRRNASRREKGAAPERASPHDDEDMAFTQSDARFLSEIEALALGKSAKSRICSELGVAEKPEAAHSFLLAIGYWDETVNPHPSRSGCSLSAPQIALGAESLEESRVDLGGIESWAVDNAWSADPDDAVGWDGSSVWIHIADPASIIAPDSPVDREALSRGATLYLPERVSPMLPDEALERFGLGLSEISKALSLRIELAEDASLKTVEIMPSRVRIKRSTYAEADRAMAEGKAEALTALADLASKRRSRRLANGAVEIDIPEVRVHVEGQGREKSISVEAIARYASSDLVREMMLLAGEAAARWAFDRGLPFPYYGQEAPSEPGQTAQADGLSAQFARRRLMRAGLWGPSPSAHRGLGLSFYAQVTSPLRRYQDLLAHMQIRAYLAGRTILNEDEISRRCALAQAASAATRQAERSSILHWTLAYLARSPGWRGEAVVVGSGSGGRYYPVYFPELGLESKIHLRAPRGLDERVAASLVAVDLAGLEVSFEEAVMQ